MLVTIRGLRVASGDLNVRLPQAPPTFQSENHGTGTWNPSASGIHDVADDVSVDIGEAPLEPVVVVGQLLVVQSQQMENHGCGGTTGVCGALKERRTKKGTEGS